MTKRTLFALGQVVCTKNALQFAEAEHIDLFALLARHHSDDWGDIGEEDRDPMNRPYRCNYASYLATAFPRIKFGLLLMRIDQ